VKQLLGIAIAGSAGALLIAFAAKIGYNVMHGRPIAHATGLSAVVLRDELTVLVMIACLVGCAIWWWTDDRINHPRWPR